MHTEYLIQNLADTLCTWALKLNKVVDQQISFHSLKNPIRAIW